MVIRPLNVKNYKERYMILDPETGKDLSTNIKLNFYKKYRLESFIKKELRNHQYNTYFENVQEILWSLNPPKNSQEVLQYINKVTLKDDTLKEKLRVVLQKYVNMLYCKSYYLKLCYTSKLDDYTSTINKIHESYPLERINSYTYAVKATNQQKKLLGDMQKKIQNILEAQATRKLAALEERPFQVDSVDLYYIQINEKAVTA